MPAELESATTVDSAGNTVTAASATAMSGGKLETLCVAIVDPISTGACLAKHLSSQGYRSCTLAAAYHSRFLAIGTCAIPTIRCHRQPHTPQAVPDLR